MTSFWLRTTCLMMLSSLMRSCEVFVRAWVCAIGAKQKLKGQRKRSYGPTSFVIGWKSVAKRPFPLPNALGRVPGMVSATEPAHLLRLVPVPRPYPVFRENRRPSSCGFIFARGAMVGGCRPNVVDGPVSWREVPGGDRAGARKAGGGSAARPRGAPRGPGRASRAPRP